MDSAHFSSDFQIAIVFRSINFWVCKKQSHIYRNFVVIIFNTTIIGQITQITVPNFCIFFGHFSFENYKNNHIFIGMMLANHLYFHRQETPWHICLIGRTSGASLTSNGASLKEFCPYQKETPSTLPLIFI